MKKLIAALLLLVLSSFAHAQQQSINCAPASPCTLSGPSATGTGDPLWLAFAKDNTNGTQLFGMFGPAISTLPIGMPLIPFSGALWGNATLVGVGSGKNLVLGTNAVQGAIEATCYGYYSCGGGGWNLPGWDGGSDPGGTGMSGAENTSYGWFSLSMCTTCSFATALGSGALGHEDTGVGETCVGEDSCRNINDGGNVANKNKQLVAVGSNSLRNCIACLNDVAVGWSAMTGPEGTPPFSTGPVNTQSTAVGASALQFLNGTSGDTAVGASAGGALTTGASDTLIGWSAGAALTTTSNNVFVGVGAGQTATTTANAVLVGQGAGANGNPASGDVAVGQNALLAASSDSNNVAVGFEAALDLTTGNNSAYVGWESGINATTAQGNTALGASALAGASGATGGLNTAIGWTALTAVSTGTNNTMVGVSAGKSITTGSQNVILGNESGTPTLTTGSSNIIIGFGQDAYAAGTSLELNIGSAIRGSMLTHSSAALTACGTSPALKAGSTEIAGTITTGSGATACTLAFNTFTSTPPTCLVTARSGTPPVYTTTDTGSTAGIQLTTAAASATYDYWCPVH